MARLVVLAAVFGLGGFLIWHYGSRYVRRLRDQQHEHQATEEALRRDREFALLPGGSPDNPLRVPSPSVVEVKAEAIRCPICGKALRAAPHPAETVGGVHLRVAPVTCTECGIAREIYFQLQQ